MTTTGISPSRFRITNICTTLDHLHEIVEAYSAFDEFVFDVETRGAHRGRPELAEVAWVSLAGPGRTDVIPCGHINGEMLEKAGQKRLPTRDVDGNQLFTEKGNARYSIQPIPPVFGPPPEQLWPSQVFGALEPLFFSERRKIGHNVKFDLTAVAKYYDDRVPPQPYGDTIVLHHLLNESMGAYKLDALIAKKYGLKYSDGKLGKIGIDNFDFWTVAKYSHLDVKYTWLLWKPFFRKLQPLELMPVFDMEMGVLEALVYMEREGATIDVDMIEDMRKRIDAKSEMIKRKLHKEAGKVWNVDAPLEKGWFVYKVRGHEPKVFTPKTKQPSTKAEDLEKYADKDPMVGLLSEYSQLHTLKSTFVDGLYEKLVEGKLHPSFLQAGTTTGRFSCAKPNLQNIPRVTEERTEFQVRDLFVAPEGHSLIVADYSQIEYRLFAHFSQDKYMIEMFTKGVDAHSAMASLILGKPPEDLTPEERTLYGKVVNFAIGFGSGPNTLARTAKISTRKAA